MVNSSQNAASPLSEERVRRLNARVDFCAGVAATEGFDEEAAELRAGVRDLLADRTALTARLEALERDAKRLDALEEHFASEAFASDGWLLPTGARALLRLDLLVTRNGSQPWPIEPPNLRQIADAALASRS